MKKLESTPGGKQAEPAATKETKTPQPVPHDPKSDPGNSNVARRIKEVENDEAGNHTEGAENVANDGNEALQVKARSHGNAVEAQREPVAATRSQDANPEANKGVTITTEGGVPVAHPGSTLR